MLSHDCLNDLTDNDYVHRIKLAFNNHVQLKQYVAYLFNVGFVFLLIKFRLQNIYNFNQQLQVYLLHLYL